MTCIVAITDGTNIWMGGDRAASDTSGTGLAIVSDPKVFVRHGEDGAVWLFGFEDSFRMGQLIQYELSLPRLPKDTEQDLRKFLVTEFIRGLRQCLRTGGFLQEEENKVEYGGCFIVGLKGKLFVVERDFYVAHYDYPYAAIGCAQDLAKGSLCSTTHEPDPEKRILAALEAAQEHSSNVRDPFDLINSRDATAPKKVRAARKRPRTKSKK